MTGPTRFFDVGTALLEGGLRIRFRTAGASMSPTIRDGEVVIVEPAAPESIRAGDIVLAASERGPLVHRVTGRAKGDGSGDLFILRGDASITADVPIPGDRIRGRVIAVERDGRPVLPDASVGETPGQETDILFACTRVRPDGRRIEDIAAGIDWDRLLEGALRHGLAPLLCRKLEEAASDLVPPPILARLRCLRDANRRRNLFLAGELAKVLDGLEAAGVRAAAFKGVALALAAYGDLSLRQFTGLDIFVDRKDLPAARDLLLSLGYRPARREVRGRSESEAIFSRKGPIFVEIHAEIAPPNLAVPLRAEDLLARRADPGRAGFPTLCPEDAILVGCIHGAKHGWERLLWIADLARLIEAGPGIEWARIAALAEETGTARILRVGLLLAEGAGARLPEMIRKWIAADRRSAVLAGNVQRRIAGARPPRGPLERFSLALAFRERRRDRLRICLRTALRPSPKDADRSSRLSSAARLPIRFLRLAVVYGPPLIGRRLRGRFSRR
jgi:signal peptidase I